MYDKMFKGRGSDRELEDSAEARAVECYLRRMMELVKKLLIEI